MKKILAFLLVAVMLCAAFVAPASAAASINTGLEAKALEDGMAAPKIDGKVGTIEYGDAALTYSKDKAQFAADDDHDDYNDWDFDFYITWDKDNLYMAWVVKSAVHHPLEKCTYDDAGNKISDAWPEDGSMLGHMWWNSCIQFIITPGAPKNGSTTYQQGAYAGNYLEVGLCQLSDGDVGRVAWCYPTGVDKSQISINDWEAAIVRDDAKKTTTYEVAIPWMMSGIRKAGTGEKFGLTFAVAAQENYNTRKGMIEWNDAILGGKQADKAGVITLKSEKVIDVSTNENIVEEGKQPEEANGKIKFVIDRLNTPLQGEDVALKTDMSADINTNWAHAILLAPVEGKDNVYSVVAHKDGDGTGEVTFDEYKKGMIILGLHSDCQDPSQAANYTGYAEKANGVALPEGTELTLWGVDVKNNKLLYTNAILYADLEEGSLVPPVEGGDESNVEESSEEPSETPSVESSEEPSEEDSKAPSAAESSEAEDGEGFPVWAIILIIVAVLAVVAVVVIVVLKKKKA